MVAGPDVRIRLSRVGVLHAVCQIPAALLAAHFVATSIRAAWTRDHRIVGLSEWAIQPWPPKIQPIVEYGALLVFAACVVIALTGYARATDKELSVAPRHALAFAGYEVICLLPYALVNPASATAIWFMLSLALPAWLVAQRWSLPPGADRTLLVACGAVIALVLGFLFSGIWSPRLFFTALPWDAGTYVAPASAQTAELSNRAPHMLKPALPARAECGAGAELGSVCLSLPRSVFASPREAFLLFPPTRGLVYDWSHERLIAHWRPRDKQIALIRAKWNLAPDDPRFAKFLASAVALDALDDEIEDQGAQTPKQPEAYRLSRSSRRLQPRGGARPQTGVFFLGHAPLFLPARDEGRGASGGVAEARDEPGLTRSIGWLLNRVDGGTFQAYMAIYWAALGAYVALVGIVALGITGQAWAAFAALILAVGVSLGIGHEALRTTPSLSPIAHFPDLLCMLAVAVNARRRSVWSGVLRASAIGLLLWWNLAFGAFMLCGSLTWLVTDVIYDADNRRAACWQIAAEVALAAGVILAAGYAAPIGAERYVLIGAGLSHTGLRNVLIVGSLWLAVAGAVMCLRFAWARGDDDASRRSLAGVAGVGAFYAAFSSVFALWEPSFLRVAVVLLLEVVPFVALVAWAAKKAAARGLKLAWMMRYMAMVPLVLVVVKTVGGQVAARTKADGAAKQHSVYSWKFAGLHGASTVDPAVMRDSVALVQKVQPTGPVLLLSRYDSLLRILMNRRGVLPYADLASALVSWEMVGTAYDQISRWAGPTVFVDRDIDVDRDGSIPLHDGEPDRFAAYRVGSLATLGLLGRLIARCYTPGETGGALQVWHRTCPPGSG